MSKLGCECMRSIWKRYSHFAARFVWVAFVLLLIYFFLMKGIFYIMPFVVATVIAFLIENPVNLLERKAKIPRSFAVLITLLIFTALSGTLLIFLISRIITEIIKFLEVIPSNETIIHYIEDVLGRGQSLYQSLPPEVLRLIEVNVGENLNSLVKTATSHITGALQSVIKTLVGLITSLPNLLVFVLITLISTFFITRDRSLITRFLLKQLPSGWDEKIRSVKDDLLVALVGFIKAQAILISITFTELLVGFSLMGLEYSLFLAIVTAIVDALPVLGTGSVLVPWAIVSLVMQNYAMAVQLLLLYGVILTVRQILEPKLVGQGLGLYPLVALLSMYIGLKVFGVGGLLLGPIITIIIKALQKARILPQWK